jgi:pimeloyl-ACP methyl ester carboxylesterase
MDEAEKELASLRKEYPKQKEKLDGAAEGIKKLSAMDRWDVIKQAVSAGRHEAAQAMLAKFPTDNADAQTQADVRTQKVRYDNATTDLKKAKKLLEQLPKEVGEGDEHKLFVEAAAALTAELNLDHFLKKGENDEGRLERFLTQADQAERFAKMNEKHLKQSELLSLAVTGWLLGPASAETKPEMAIRVWKARRLVMEYQKAAAVVGGGKLLKDYLDDKPLSVAEIAQLIPNLPPIDPPVKIPVGEVTMTVGGGKGTKYQLKLPPEYHPGRPYPVLIALHHRGESGKDMVKRWEEGAAQWGYILACPDWGDGEYSYSPAEHATVLETLRDLRQHFNVDSDRVFLTGYGEGGNMAWDVGLSHPDLFAGVAPIDGQPRFQAKTCWTNCMELPFYVVWGERMGGPNLNKKEDANVENFNQFKEFWIPGGAPAIGVLYKGRGLEWFSAEVTDIFEWMAQKRRHNPMKIGYKDVVVNNDKGEVTEYRKPIRTLRPEDNRFYWITLDGLTIKKEPATLAARIRDGNRIGVETSSVKRVTLWLGRGMIDFSKEIAVQRNAGVAQKFTVTPSLATLLDDYIERGDRQQLFFARIDLK